MSKYLDKPKTPSPNTSRINFIQLISSPEFDEQNPHHHHLQFNEHSAEVTEGALQVWQSLPPAIRQDPSLASFRQEHERLHGLDEHVEDPLPNEDVSADENPVHDPNNYNNNNNNNNSDTATNYNKNKAITINVTNEEGHLVNIPEKKQHGGHHQHSSGHNHHVSPHGGGGGGGDDDGGEKKNQTFHNIKIGILLVLWILFTGALMITNEKVLSYRQISIPVNQERNWLIDPLPTSGSNVGIVLEGGFRPELHWNATADFLTIYITLQNTLTDDKPEIVSERLRVAILNATTLYTVKDSKRSLVLGIGPVAMSKALRNDNSRLAIVMETNIDVSLPLKFAYDPSPIDKARGVIYAAFVLLGLYILIIWEIVHRTFAAMIASTMAIGILAAMNQRPALPLLMSWIDVETLLLLFGMMILVAILSETGIFDYLAVYAYKITNGKVWPLINCLCLFTAVLSAFLDNVTTVLLMTPVSIRLCEVMELNPVPILMAMIIYSNVGGTMTPVGDPPNVIIASNAYISKNGVTFMTFTLHMALGVIMVMVQTYYQLRYKFRNINDLRFNEPQDVQELRHEITVWQRAAASLSSYSKDEDLVRETLLKKVNRLNRILKKKMISGAVPVESYKATLEELQAKYPIRNIPLLVKSGVTLVFAITFFFLHSVPDIQRLSLGWTALLAAILLLILADREDMDSILARVEWSTLLFFAALFILMEALSELGLIDWIGKQTENVIMSVSEEYRLATALLLILWVSAIASAFVDNIPLTTMMVKIAISLAENETLGLPLKPLVWALAFGACLGGNGTLIGASANVVCAGVAEQHGYRFTFVEYFKVGFPIMIGSICVATVYLLICHVLFTWH